MRKFILTIIFMCTIIAGNQILSPNVSEASDIWAFTDGNGYQYYIVTESISHMKGGEFFVDAKIVNPSTNRWNRYSYTFSADEGDYWGGIRGLREGKRIRNYPYLRAIYMTAYKYKYGTYPSGL